MFLAYPGLVATLALTVLFAVLANERVQVPNAAHVQAVRSTEGIVGLASIAFAIWGITLLPWPLHPAPLLPWIDHPIAIWAVLEASFLAPALLGLLSNSPFATRANLREVQMGVAGRCIVWIAIGGALWLPVDWSIASLPGRGLLLLAGLLAMPAAIGYGPFGAERNLSTAGSEEGLDEATSGVLRSARAVRGSVLLLALIVASLAWSPVPPWIILMLTLAIFIVATLLIRQVSLVLPRLTLPGALHWCWWRVMPIALLGFMLRVVVA